MKKTSYVIQVILIGVFIIPFSLGKLHKNIIKSPLMLFIYYSSFFFAGIFIVVFVLTKDEWFNHVAISLDQLGNTALGGCEDNTISGRLGEKIKANKANSFEKRLCYLLSLLDPTSQTHCISSIEDEEQNC